MVICCQNLIYLLSNNSTYLSKLFKQPGSHISETIRHCVKISLQSIGYVFGIQQLCILFISESFRGNIFKNLQEFLYCGLSIRGKDWNCIQLQVLVINFQIQSTLNIKFCHSGENSRSNLKLSYNYKSIIRISFLEKLFSGRIKL